MKKRATAYWLIPSGSEWELLREVMGILCKGFDAPGFAPHLTVLVTSQSHSPRKVLEQVRAAPIRLNVRDVGFSSQYTKTLFVRFKPSAQLKQLTTDLSRATRSRGRPARDPHISLLYKKLPRAVKAQLASFLRLPFRRVVFDSIQAVRCVSPTKTRADVEAWRVVARRSLT
jgi:2'-5' RNA ligase